MMLSTVWLAIAVVLALNGHDLTSAVPIVPWFLHRRWERRQPRRRRGPEPS
jgi:hypothetical protein